MTDTMETARWVERAKSGDPSALEELAGAYLRPAYVVALALLGRPADAEDTAQDALLSALEHIDSCRDATKFGAWLRQIVRNRAKNRLAGRRFRDVPKTEDAADPPDRRAPNTVAERRDLLRALGAVSLVQREVVLLHDLEGWSHKEIGEILGISEMMSRQHLFRARQRMRAELAGEGETRGVL